MKAREMAEKFLEAFAFARTLDVDVGFAEAVFEGGEWELVLVELETISDKEFLNKFGENLKEIRVFLGNPTDPFRVA